MALVRVPVSGTIGKAVRINPDATVGSQIGVNLQLSDDSIPDLAELALALYAASPPTVTVGETSSGSLGFVFESDVIDGVLLARVADDETITGAYTFQNAAGIVIQDAGGTDSAALSHDGADFNYVYTNTGTVASSGAAFYKFDNNLTLQSATTLPVFSSIGGINNHSIAISPTGMVFNHDIGSQTFTISGAISDIAAGTIDVDFDAITATSYGGILEANLLDKTVNEIVTGRWDFESDGSAPQLCIVDSDSNGVATRAFIEYLGKGDVLTGRMGYLSATSGIFTIDNALPNAGIELTNAGVQKLRININGTTVTGTLFVNNTSGEKVVLKDTDSTGDAVLNFIAFKDMNNLRQGFVGFGSSGNDDLLIATDSGFGDVLLNPQGVAALRASNVAVAISVPLTATSYDGILAANLLDKNATETITGSWNFDSDVSIRSASQLSIFDSGNVDSVNLSHNGADFIISDGGGTGVMRLVNLGLTIDDGQVFTILDPTGADSLAQNHDGADFNSVFTNTTNWNISGITAILAGTVDADFDAITATSYGGILEANLLDKTVAEIISGVYKFTNEFILERGTPIIRFTETDAAADNQKWEFLAVAEQLRFRTSNDAGTASANWLTVDRTGTVINAVNILAPLTATSIRTALGTVGAPSRFFEGDTDTGDFSPGANIYAITVGGVEAIRWTGASIPAVDFALESGITASTTQTQGQRPLTASYNEVSIVANDNDVVTLPICAKGRLCLVINRGAKKLQLFPSSGVDLGQGLNSSTTIEPNSSLFFAGINPTSWHETASDKTYRVGHTYGIISKIKVPNGQKDFIIPFFVSLASGQTAKLVKARHVINTGTSVTCKLQKNGSDITGFTGISVTTTAADTDPADVTLADNDKLALVVTAISGAPQNMSFTLFIEYTQ